MSTTHDQASTSRPAGPMGVLIHRAVLALDPGPSDVGKVRQSLMAIAASVDDVGDLEALVDAMERRASGDSTSRQLLAERFGSVSRG